MRESPRIRLVAYGVAVLAPAVTLLIERPLAPVQGDRVLYMAFFPAVLIAAYLGGFWPGLLATVLSALAATYFLIDPTHSLAITTIHNAVAVSLFALVGAVISGLSEALHRARHRIVAEERRRAAEALSESEERFRFLVQNSWDIISLFDAKGTVLYQAPSVGRLLGHRPQDRIGRNVFRDPIVHPDDLAAKRAFFDAIRGRPGAPVTAEFRLRHADGSWREIEAIGQNFLHDPSVAGIVTNYRDITERKRIEAALRESEERIRKLLSLMPAAVYTCDAEGRITFYNRRAAELWGRAPQLGVDDVKFCASLRLWQTDGSPLPHDRTPIAACIRDGRSTRNAEVVIEQPDGARVIVSVNIEALYNHEGGRAGAINVFEDITERRRAEEALRESEERFRMLAKATNDAVWDWDLSTNKVWWNEGVLTLFGYRLEKNEAEPGWWLERVHPDDRAAVEAYFFDVVRGTELSWVDEYRFRCADGSYKDVYDRGYVLRDTERRAVRMIGAMLDITARKRAEEAMRESEEQFRRAVLYAPFPILIHAEGGEVLQVSQTWTELTGYTQEDLRTVSDWTRRAYGERKALVESDIDRLYLVDGRVQEGEYVITTRSGETRTWDFNSASLGRLPDGRRRVISMAMDVTERKQADEALRESERRFRTLAEALPHWVWTTGPDGALDYISPRNVEYTGLTPEQFRDWGSYVHPEDLPRCSELWARSIATGEPYEAEHRLRRVDGAFRWHVARALALRDDSGRITRWLGSCADIDDQKRAQEALREAKEAAEAANRAKDEFLANVSHEIRTPMNAILGMTELALDTPLTDDQRQCLRTVKSAADSLLGVINDLLDFSKIEAGKLELDPADFSLRAAVGDTLRALATRAHKKGLELACNVQPDVSDALVGDAARLRQVLLNLVGNAIKFTEHGEVVVRVEVADGPPREEGAATTQTGSPAVIGEVGLQFTVTDSGIGIPPDKQERIFRAFEQEDTSTTRRYGGTGLGLTIAARLVALMGGSIAVYSEPGRGSTFAFTARFGRQPHPAGQTPAWPPVVLQGLRVLVVDDNPTNRHILQEWLTGWQMEPVAVGDGLAALGALWDAVSVGRPYPLVLLDARMPDTDGLALAARIRERAALPAVRIILLTSDHRPGDLARSRELRIDAHLLKPVQQDELLETIYRVMSRAQGDAPTAVEEASREPGPVPAAAPLQILLAEDNEFSAELMEKLLAGRGHRVRLATNGREALVLAGQGAFDLMLLDVHMPELDGIEVVRGVRERERVAGGHLPVIALTARSRKEDRERCLEAGMDDFLTKPIRPADLFGAIDRLVPARGVSRPAQADAGEHIGVLDPVAVLTACGDDEEALRRMCRAFETYLPVRLTEVGDALRAEDAPRLREAAHKLCALLFAFSTTAGNAASDLEDHAAQGRLDEAWPLVERLETMAPELVRLAAGLSLETLRQQAEATGDVQRTAGR